MEIVFVLIPLSVLLLAIAVGIFIWAVNNGQFDDMDSPAWKILVDEEKRDRSRKERQHDQR
ncbi:MAG: cbb3-type cytochrome oxidase assembly protein CcoS [Gammaproteobacteria bacterium]|nr:cbb3-type cytochrome oxidase assembly protein CcoS [Gammaproteobacteria bacterium]